MPIEHTKSADTKSAERADPIQSERVAALEGQGKDETKSAKSPQSEEGSTPSPTNIKSRRSLASQKLPSSGSLMTTSSQAETNSTSSTNAKSQGPPFPFFVLGLPHVTTVVELRLAFVSYRNYHMLLLTLRRPSVDGVTKVPKISTRKIFDDDLLR